LKAKPEENASQSNQGHRRIFIGRGRVRLGTYPGERKPLLRLIDAKGSPVTPRSTVVPRDSWMSMVGLVLLIALPNAAMLLLTRYAPRLTFGDRLL
jgi:hypothetical protein